MQNVSTNLRRANFQDFFQLFPPQCRLKTTIDSQQAMEILFCFHENSSGFKGRWLESEALAGAGFRDKLKRRVAWQILTRTVTVSSPALTWRSSERQRQSPAWDTSYFKKKFKIWKLSSENLVKTYINGSKNFCIVLIFHQKLMFERKRFFCFSKIGIFSTTNLKVKSKRMRRQHVMHIMKLQKSFRIQLITRHLIWNRVFPFIRKHKQSTTEEFTKLKKSKETIFSLFVVFEGMNDAKELTVITAGLSLECIETRSNEVHFRK